MLYLLQILKKLDDKEIVLFNQLFSNLDFELDELGYREFPEELVSDMLFNHFGLEILLKSQLSKLTKTILKPGSVEATVNMIQITKQMTGE